MFVLWSWIGSTWLCVSAARPMAKARLLMPRAAVALTPVRYQAESAAKAQRSHGVKRLCIGGHSVKLLYLPMAALSECSPTGNGRNKGGQTRARVSFDFERTNEGPVGAAAGWRKAGQRRTA